jgi:hypothetical protein
MCHEGTKGWIGVYLNPFFNFGARSGWVGNVIPRPLKPQEIGPVSILQEARWAVGPVWTGAEDLARSRVRMWTVQLY